MKEIEKLEGELGALSHRTSLLKTLILSQTLFSFQVVIFYDHERPHDCIINFTILIQLGY